MIAVSVFIVTHNSAPFLRSCLDSLRVQTLTDFEIILVDNASKDDTLAIVKTEYPEVHILENPKNLGFGNANNFALTMAKGRYVVLLHPDVVMLPDTLQSAFKHMERQLDVGMGGGWLKNPRGEQEASARKFPSLLNEILALTGLAQRFPHSRFFGRFEHAWEQVSEATEVDWLPGAFVILRRSLLTEIRLFDARFFLYYEQVDLCRRIYDAEFKVYFWPDLVVTHIGGPFEDLGETAVLDTNQPLTLWRLQSQLLYYHKWHGSVYCWLLNKLVHVVLRLRIVINCRHNSLIAIESKTFLTLWKLAWTETKGGSFSPQQPW